VILTVTANPALDYTVRLDSLEIGRRHKYRDPFIDPAGKGINVARMVRRLGEPTLALGFAAGPTGDLLRQRLDEEAVPHDLIPVPGLTRINITLLTGPEGSATHLHGAGSRVPEEHLKKLLIRASKHLSKAKVLVFSGSLPPGVPPSAIADLVVRARKKGVFTIVDAEKDMLGAALEAGADLVKPNIHETAEFLDKPLSGVDAAVGAAKELCSRGARSAVITMRQDGAIAFRQGKSWHARPPRDEVVRAIGAGDSFCAGLAVAIARGEDLPDALRLAAAAGAATARNSGTGLGSAEQTSILRPLVEVRPL
jgi:1-phosphofructokinase family hexose kinase